MSKTRCRRSSAFTLLELLVGMSISSVVLAGISLTSVALQRSFVAADYRMSSQNDQLRVLDYVSRDLHMASAVTILNGGTKLTMTLPPSSSGSINLTLAPPLNALLGLSLGATGNTTVAYYVEGGQLIRELNGAQTVIASTVDDLTFTRQGSVVSTSILFTPQFVLDPTTAAQQATRATNSTSLLNLIPGN